ncbi:uncharacterized protein JN550_012165 [Neoarthrinium moseri]|uniref:uncharacterized protein n=1 Tax=Neoarthrinium moseri TaxID=1658444 RepID=UPI001FDD6511|nr:uncharacterized protein JN550_012165 [Neoarthrinium moseri]KAI1859245.1 hypothetical protein JN550_012165 [Neoarthrinium moseri]
MNTQLGASSTAADIGSLNLSDLHSLLCEIESTNESGDSSLHVDDDTSISKLSPAQEPPRLSGKNDVPQEACLQAKVIPQSTYSTGSSHRKQLGHQTVHILDLPDEILRHIFGFQATHLLGISSDNSQIKPLRLVCRRFNEQSSHLLLNRLTLDFTRSSLEKLETVSKHPIISKGIRNVHFELHTWSSTLAASLSAFARYHLTNGRDNLLGNISRSPAARVSRRVTHSNSDRRGMVSRALLMYATVDQELPSVSGLEPVNDDGIESVEAYQRLLRRAHEEYQHLYDYQRKLLKNETFITTVVSAISRMPAIDKLEFRDFNPLVADQRHVLVPNADSDFAIFQAELYNKLVSPMPWGAAAGYCQESPIRLLFQLLSGLSDTEVRVTSLKVDFTFSGDSTLLKITEPDRHKITEAMQRLKSFDFKLACSWPTTEPDFSFLTAITKTRRLSHLRLHGGGIEQEPSSLAPHLQHELAIGPVLNRQQWPSLSTVFLDCVSVNQSTLSRYVQCLPAGCQLELRKVRLTDGFWVKVLDVLRDCPARVEMLVDPDGGERRVMAEGEWSSYFGMASGTFWSKSRAEKYIMGWDKVNPLAQGGW